MKVDLEQIALSQQKQGCGSAIHQGIGIDFTAPQYILLRPSIPGMGKVNKKLQPLGNLAHMRLETSRSAEEEAEQVALSLGLPGTGCVFKTACHLNTQRQNGSQVLKQKTTRVISFAKYRVIQDTFRSSALAELAEAFEPLSPHDVVANYGEFWAESCSLGCLLKATYVMEVSTEDSEQSLRSDLEASYKKLFKKAVSGELSSQPRLSAPHCDLSCQVSIAGGSTALWAGWTQERDGEIKQAWVNSMTDENLFAFDFKLRPIWDLVSKVDVAKAKEIETLLNAQWQQQTIPIYKKLEPAPLRRGYLQNIKTGLVIGVRDGNKDKGTDLVVWSKNGSDNQLWMLSNGFLISGLGDLVAGIKKNSREPGAQLGTWTKDDNWDKKWIMTPDGFIENMHTGLVIGIKANREDRGAEVATWTKDDNWDKQWKFSWHPSEKVFT